jgi:hypothetical protein
MIYRMSKLHVGGRSEAQIFLSETRFFPLAGASITFLLAGNVAATLAMLLGQS